MVNIVLLIIFLHNRLCYYLLTWNWNTFYSSYVLGLNRLQNRFKLNFLVISSVNLYIHFFSLNDWLVYFLIIDFHTRFYQNFFSKIISYYRLLRNWSQIHQLIFLRNELNLLLVLNYFFLINWLKIQLLSRLLVLSANDLLIVLDGLVDVVLLKNSIFTSLNSYLFFNRFHIRLH